MAFASRVSRGRDDSQVDHPIFPRIATHSVCALNRFCIRDNGLNSFHRRYGNGALPVLADFGGKSTSRLMASTSLRRHILHAALAFGSGERSRFERMQPSQRFSTDLLAVSRSVLWRLKGDGSFGQTIFLMQKHLQIANEQPTSSVQEPSPSPAEVQEGGMELRLQDNRDAILLEQPAYVPAAGMPMMTTGGFDVATTIFKNIDHIHDDDW